MIHCMNADVCLFYFLGIQVLLYVCIALSHLSESAPINETGTYFLHVNKIYVIYSSWLVMFTHDLKPYGANIRKVQNSIDNFSNSFAKINKSPLPSNLPDQTRFKLQNLTSKLHTLFQSEYQQFQRSLTHLQKAFVDLKSVNTMKDNKRSKRSSWFPFIGTLGSRLFGVATEGDLKQVNKGLKNLKESNKEILHLLKNSMSVINKMNQNVQINRKIINQLIKATDTLDKRVQLLYETYAHKISLQLDYTQTSIELHSVFHIINSALDSLRTLFTRLSSQVNNLYMGALPYDLVPPKTLQNILLDIQKQLRPSLMLPHPVTGNLDKYYKLLHTILIPDKMKFHVLTSVPLAHTNDQYDVYRVINLPIPLNDHKAIQYTPEYPYIAVTQDKSSYALLTQTEAALCHHDNLDYCPLGSPSYDTDLNPNCILSLFLKDSMLIRSHCKPNIQDSNFAPVLEHVVNGKWLSSSPRPYNVEMSCDKRIETIERGIQEIDLKQGCNAYTSFFRLPPYFRQQSKHDINKSFKVLLDTPIDLQDFEIPQNSPKHLNHTILSQIPELINIQPDLDQVKDDIENALSKVDKINIEDDDTSMVLYIVMVIGSLGLCLSLLLLCVYYKNLCKGKFCVNGYKSHKREKANAKDKVKVKDIEADAVEMAPLDTTAVRPINKDSIQEVKTEALVFNFTGKDNK